MSRVERDITLARLVREIGEDGDKGRFLLRLEKQFGGHIPVDDKVLKEIEDGGLLSPLDKARLFSRITEGRGVGSTHSSAQSNHRSPRYIERQPKRG